MATAFFVKEDTTLSIMQVKKIHPPAHVVVVSDEYEGYENIATLAHTIPIYLRHSKPEKKDDNSIIDLLGAYYSNRHGDTPYIELYLKGIDDATNGNDEHFKWLFVKVLIHELAHAALDIFN